MPHDSSYCISAFEKDTSPVVFQNGCTVQEMAELSSSCVSLEENPTFNSRLKDLLQLRKNNQNVAADLHKLLLCSIYPIYIQKILHFEIPLSCIPNVNSLLDIGYIVRRLLLKWHSPNILYRLYQYSMPFIKHNRLNFPSLKNLNVILLKHMVMAIFFTCMGSHHTHTKTPVWQITRQLYIFFNSLLTKGTAADLYIFCEQHVYLLRLSLIEHFIAFTNKNMQVEVFLMPFFVDVTYQHSRVSKQLQYITDTFRQTTMQEQELDWIFIESKAQQAIERCNRTCKAMPNFKTTSPAPQTNIWDSEVMITGMKLPKLQPFDILAQETNGKQIDVLALAQIAQLHKRIQKFVLPIHLQKRHYESMVGDTNTNLCLLFKSFLFVCMQCNTVFPKATKDMRYHFEHKAICTHCLQKDFVVQIQTLGHLVLVNTNYYYFCEFCHSVHLWQASGSEFCQCPYTNKNNVTKHCIICYRTMNLSTIRILDKKLGVMQTVMLCNKHTPHHTKLPYAYDLVSLKRLIEFDT